MAFYIKVEDTIKTTMAIIELSFPIQVVLKRYTKKEKISQVACLIVNLF